MATIASLAVDVYANTVKLTKDVDDIKSKLDSMEGPTRGITTRMVALGAAIGTALGVLAADAIRRVASGVVDLASNGIKLAPTVDAFMRLSAAAGQSGDEMLRITKTATKGLIADLDIMQAANKGLLLGLPITSQEMGTLGQTAVVLGKAMGQGAAKSMDDLITALGRSSPLILDNLGLSVKVGEANDAYARSLGKSSSSLTDAEKKLAFYNAAMAAAKAKVADLGGVQLTLADRLLQVRNGVTNFTDALGVAIATSPVVNTALGAIADAIGSAFGDNQTVLVQKLIGYVNRFAIGLVDAAQFGVTTAGILDQAWSGLKLLFAGTASIVTAIGLAFANLVAGAANLATKIPGLGSAFDGVSRSAREMATFMGGVQQSFHEQAEEALEGVKGNSAFHQALDRVSGSLATMRGKMVEASQAGVSSAEIAARLVKTHDDVAEAVTKSTAAQDKFRQSVDDATIKMNLSIFNLHRFHAQTLPDVTSSLEGVDLEIRDLTATTLPQFGVSIDDVGQKASVSFKRVLTSAQQLKSGLVQTLGGLNNVFQAAFEGGGGVSGAVKSVATSAVAALTSVIPVVGPVISKFSGAIVSGFSKLFGGIFSNPEKQINPIREAFVQAAGGLGALNEKAHTAGLTLDRLLDAKNPQQYRSAIDELNAAFARQEAAVASAGEAATKANTEAKAATDARMAALNRDLDSLTTRRESLWQSIAGEAPEEVMGVVEAGVRAQLGVLDDQITQQRNRIELETQSAADGLEDALSAITPTAVHVPVVWDIPDLPGGSASLPAFPQAAGGDYLVTRPTLFLAGEAGPERATFTPQGKGGGGRFDTSALERKMDALLSEFRSLPRNLAIQTAGASALAMAR